MAFVTAARDYIDFLNSSFHAFGHDISTQQILQQTALYLVESCRVALIYLVTLQWLRDFIYLPIIIPKYTALIYQEALVFAHDPVNIFTFGETPTFVQNKFFVGFFNSIFACLPFSCAHLVALRRFYLQGWPVAFATSLGIIAGHIFFLMPVLFGWRTLLFPWLHFEPWNYVIGFLLITSVVYTFGRPAGVAQYRSFTPKDLKIYASMGFTAFVLTLCEQGVIFQHLTTFTVGLEPSFMEPLTGTSQNLVLAHSNYLLGFLLGSLVFTILSYGAALGFRFIVTQTCLITEVRFHMYYQQYSRYLIMGIAVTTVPFYGLDYFVTNPLGFVPNDSALVRGSLFAQNTLLDTWFKERKGEYTAEMPELLATYPSFGDYPLAGFDRGIYFTYKVGQRNMDSGGVDTWLSDEDYMLPVENAWRSNSKRQQVRRRDLMRRHRASLKRVKTWLRKIAPALAEAEQTRLEQRQQKLSSTGNKDVLVFETRAKDNKQWVPEHFNQFQVLDNYTFGRDRYRLRPQTKALKAVINQSRHLFKKKGAFEDKDFEKINRLTRVLNRTVYRQSRRNDALKTKRDPLMTGRKTLKKAPRYALVQNFEEKIQRQVLDKHLRHPKFPKNYYYIRLWEALNAFLPEDVQNASMSLKEFKVPFRGRKHRRANRRFRNNLFYKPLMRLDIDAFLNRQPKHHLLTPTEEAELYFKRTMLSDYYNSMRRYKNMQNSRQFLLAYGGTKSLAHKVYNHQFKGTYRIAQRLFSVDLRPGNHPGFPKTRQRVLKYDQPLYDETKLHNPMLHEELQKRREVLTKKLEREASQSPEERAYKARRILGTKRLPFFRETNTRPFYCGWDERKRQFVLTNRYTPRQDTGLKAKKGSLGGKQGHDTMIRFTSWPIQKPRIGRSDKKLRGVFPVNRRNRLTFTNEYDQVIAKLFDPIRPAPQYARPDSRGLRSWKNFREWPAGMLVIDAYNPLRWWYRDLPPTPFADRGGFVWPGHRKLKTRALPNEINEVLNKQPQALLSEVAKTLRDKATAFYSTLVT